MSSELILKNAASITTASKKIRALENRTYIPYCSLAEEAKRLKCNGSILTIDKDGSLSFSGNILGKNITSKNIIEIQANRTDIDEIKEVLKGVLDITDLATINAQLSSKVSFYGYPTMDDIINDWSNIPNNTIVLSTQGADQWSATFTYKYNPYRSLSFTIPKDEKDYLWTRFQGSNNNPWSNASVWRKIPVLTTSDNLVCNNVKEDNEIRLKKLEETISSKEHTHTISDITDYINDINQRLLFYTQTKNYGINVYGDAIIEARGSLKYNGTNVSLEGHTHTISDITDYEAPVAYDDTEVRELINGKADKEHKHEDILNKIADNEQRLKAAQQSITDLDNKKVDKASIILRTVTGTCEHKGSLNGNQCVVMTYSEDNKNFIIKIPRLNTYFSKVYINGYLDGTLSMNNNNTSQGIFTIVEKYTFTFDRVEENYTDSFVFKTTISGVTYEDRYEITKTTTYNWNNPTKDENKIPSVGFLIKWFYPIGSIYVSMNNINPSNFLGGTWKQITDRFLYCANSSKQTGGSKKISIAQLPPHDHEMYCTANSGGTGIRATYNYDSTVLERYPMGVQGGTTGAGEDYMPPYMTVFAWYRTA